MTTSTPKFKAIFTDLDGTAIPSSPSGLPSARVIAAVKKAQEKVFVSVATGRPFTMCNHVLDLMGITNLCVVTGGAQIVNPATDEIIWEKALSDETMAHILELAKPYVWHDDHGKLPDKLSDEAVFTGSQRALVFIGLDVSEADRLMAKFKTIPELTLLKVHSWHKGRWDIHISHIGASKRHALEVLLGMLNLQPHEVIGIGDSQNDVPLFEAVGFKVAMGNAAEELKALADYVAPSVEEDGLAHVIEKFILNPN